MNFSHQENRRRIHLVDHVLQKSLLAALVILETVAVAIAIWAMYRALAKIVDENMYRIHFSGSVDVLTLLMSEGMRVLGGMLLVNLLALIVADRIWAFYVHRILRSLRRLMTASGQLNLSAQDPDSFDHVVLEQARTWRASEAARFARARDCIRQLPPQMPASLQHRDVVAAQLAKIQGD